MRILLISDIHGNHLGLKTVLKDAGRVDMILCAGDFSGYYPFVNEVVALCKKNSVIGVLGNHDAYLLGMPMPKEKSISVRRSVEFMRQHVSEESLAYLQALPTKRNLMIDGKKVLLVHGSPWDPLEDRIYPDFGQFEKFSSCKEDVVIMGQTHRPFIKKVANVYVLNSGSIGQPRDYNALSYIVWDTHVNSFENKRLTWDIEAFISLCKKKNTPEEFFAVFERKKINPVQE